jgi:two-component system, chemotaxis family, chemotaxis protein CheY
VSTSISPVRILIVDDRPDVRLSLTYMLEALGYAVAEASDGAAALDVMAKQKIDVVLTDLYMPGLDGLGLIRAIRRMEAPQPFIIVISGSEHVGVDLARTAAEELGAEAILRKPISRQVLVQAITDLGKRKKLES